VGCASGSRLPGGGGSGVWVGVRGGSADSSVNN
jgi:hypothetical protein